MVHNVLFLTERSLRHQRAALEGAPPELSITMLRQPSRTAIVSDLADVEFLITERAGAVDAEMIAAGPKLRLIQRLGSLTYDIDLAAAKRQGVAVCYWPILGCIMVAEHMVMQMLALVKKLPEVNSIAKAAGEWGCPSQRTDENIFAYNWSGREGIGGINGATVGILGLGEIGVELARRLIPFRPAQIIYHKRQRLPEAVELELGLTNVEQDELVADSDFLCSLLPYNPNTDHLLDAALFAQMKQGSFVVHCGSGSVIDEQALANAIHCGHLGGAALDTFEWEPIRPDNPLLPLARDPAANVLLTPHIAAGAVRADMQDGTQGRQSEYENLVRLLNGEALRYRVA
jgi:phosphoglycerate dehydrogenase-like enzyme